MSSDDKGKALMDAVTKRFLKENKEFKTVNDILESNITCLKKVDDKSAKLLEEAAFITRVADLVDLDPGRPFESLMEGRGEVVDPIRFSIMKDTIISRLQGIVSEELMRDIIVAAKLISRAEKKQEFYIKEKAQQKILFLGLDNAGKTAIINVLSGKINPSFFARLKPTKRVQREQIVTKNFEIAIWDLGGQKEYRDSYLKKENLELFFLQTDMLVYVIDMQDLSRLKESMDYLTQILDTLKYLGEAPFILFFLHKSDPDIIEEPEFQINIETVKDTLIEVIGKYKFDYDAYPTSIYYLYSKEAKFTGFIKGVLDEQKESEKEKKDPVKVLGEVLDTAMALTVNLANTVQAEFEKVSMQLYQLESRIAAIESRLGGGAQVPLPAVSSAPSLVSQPVPGIAAPVPQNLPPPPPLAGAQQGTAQPLISSKEVKPEHQNIRMTMMDELKTIFAKRRAQYS